MTSRWPVAAACVSVCGWSPGCGCNPLFDYGETKLGPFRLLARKSQQLADRAPIALPVLQVGVGQGSIDIEHDQLHAKRPDRTEIIAGFEIASALDQFQRPQSAQGVVETATIRFVAGSRGDL